MESLTLKAGEHTRGQKKIICKKRSSILVLMGCFQLGKQNSTDDVPNFGVGPVIVPGSLLAQLIIG